MLRWVTEFIHDNHENWEKKRIEEEKKIHKELDDCEKLKRFKKIENSKKMEQRRKFRGNFSYRRLTTNGKAMRSLEKKKSRNQHFSRNRF